MYSFKEQILVELHYRNVNIGISKESNYKVNEHFNYLFVIILCKMLSEK